MKDNNTIIGLIALSNLKGIGPAFIKKGVHQSSFSSPSIVEDIKRITLSNNKQFDDDTIFDAIEDARDIIFKCKENNIKIISLLDDKYPALLKELKDSPPVIYCKGNIELLYSNIVTIIGTREPNETGLKIAERVGLHFSKSGWTICNGLAEGIDIYAIKYDEQIHNNIIGVLACGLNAFNKKNAKIAELVIENNGLLVSELKPDLKEDTFTIVKSCRIQAGLAHGLIIIQSTIDGGTKFATKAFCETGRPLGIINPILSDYNLSNYEANREIIENNVKGLSKFTELKEDKIVATDILVIKSKDDYLNFEKLIRENEKTKKTLF